WLVGPLAPANDVRIRGLAGPAGFRLLDWETVHLAEQLTALWAGLTQPSNATDADGDTLRTYFQDKSRRAELRSAAQAALEHEVAQSYRDAGVTRSEPLPLASVFPPVRSEEHTSELQSLR